MAIQMLCVCGVDAKTAALASNKVRVWRFEQRNQIGKAIVLVGENGIKVTNPHQNVIWICTAPKWDVTIVNYKLNIGKSVPLSQWESRVSRFESSQAADPVSRETIMFQGKPCNKLRFEILSSDPVKERIEMIYQTGSQRASSFNAAEVICSNWFKIKPEICAFLTGLYSIKQVSGVLMSQTYIYPGKRTHVVVSTDSFKQVEVDKSEFKIPTGFKFAHMHQIMQEEKKALQMSGVIEDLFYDAAAKKHPVSTKAPAKGKTENNSSVKSSRQR